MNRFEYVIPRDGYVLGEYRLDDSGHCTACGTAIAGVFEGPAEHWGQRRQPVTLRRSGSHPQHQCVLPGSAPNRFRS